MPPDFSLSDRTNWDGRQSLMMDYYKDAATTKLGRDDLAAEYAAIAHILQSYSGRILDLGGGIGLTRQYLSPSAEYIVIDPDSNWLELPMTLLTEAFPRTASKPLFLRGVGEYLPFRDHVFDAVLGLWMLNHVSQPEKVVREACRVLRPNGLLLLVLEDMPGDVHSRWGDNPHVDSSREVSGNYHVVQDDHIAISEQQLWQWTVGRMERIRREWVGGYLTIEFEKPALSPSP